ncbi:hypothetical protein AB0392_54640 [Nonomuraea angiospora]|uniref:hypothetical protein n=1 Tax=Nonomuraea angiospora TaxID=46172 RepID=UPI00344E7E4B
MKRDNQKRGSRSPSPKRTKKAAGEPGESIRALVKTKRDALPANVPPPGTLAELMSLRDVSESHLLPFLDLNDIFELAATNSSFLVKVADFVFNPAAAGPGRSLRIPPPSLASIQTRPAAHWNDLLKEPLDLFEAIFGDRTEGENALYSAVKYWLIHVARLGPRVPPGQLLWTLKEMYGRGLDRQLVTAHDQGSDESGDTEVAPGPYDGARKLFEIAADIVAPTENEVQLPLLVADLAAVNNLLLNQQTVVELHDMMVDLPIWNMERDDPLFKDRLNEHAAEAEKEQK